jgi:hypothetical protein
VASDDVEVLRRLAAHVRGLPAVDIQTLRGQLRTLLPDEPPWVGRFGRLLGGICHHAYRRDPGSHDPVHASDRLFARGPAATADLVLDYADALRPPSPRRSAAGADPAGERGGERPAAEWELSPRWR